ncbi:MAG: Mur ligase family protein [Alphaproteobacteria bacterium]|nr:Mur ligase family protein [Alphaproteobacteria bacterium]
MKGISSFFSVLSIRYIIELLYILQIHDYETTAFIRWWVFAPSYKNLQKRKTLLYTKRIVLTLLLVVSTILFGLAWILLYAPVAIVGGIALIVTLYVVGTPIIICIYNIILHIGIQIYIIYVLTQIDAYMKNYKGISICIVGSFGKTTLRTIITHIVQQEKSVDTPSKNFNTPIGIYRFIQTLERAPEVLIFEIGEYYKGDIDQLAKVLHPRISIISGINNTHIERMKHQDTIRDTLLEIVPYTPEGSLYAPRHKLFSDYLPAHTNIYERGTCENISISCETQDLSGTKGTYTHGDISFTYKTDLVGMHIPTYLAVAAHIANHIGISENAVQQGIKTLKQIPHRFEIYKKNDLFFIDDSYNGNEDGVLSLIAFANTLSNRTIMIVSGIVELGKMNMAVHERIGKELATSRIAHIICIENSATTYIEETLYKEKYSGIISKETSVPKALQTLHTRTLPGDVIIIQNDWPDQYV